MTPEGKLETSNIFSLGILARLEEILARRSLNVVIVCFCFSILARSKKSWRNLALRPLNIIIVYLCFSFLACLEGILAHASRDANSDRQGPARLEKLLAQPCALGLGFFLGRILYICFFSYKDV